VGAIIMLALLGLVILVAVIGLLTMIIGGPSHQVGAYGGRSPISLGGSVHGVRRVERRGTVRMGQAEIYTTFG